MDYENNKNLIKTDITKFKSYVNKLKNQFYRKAHEVDKLKKFIAVIYTPQV
ncbi:hypothetical protein QIA01_05455 (plasmid) [Borreliella americana]